MKLYYYNNKWNWSTSGMIDANDAPASDNMTFYDLVKSANNYTDIDFDSLDKDNTYMFELVSPLKRIVVQYNQTLLYHIGTRNNKTGKEFSKVWYITYTIEEIKDSVENIPLNIIYKDKNNTITTANMY